MDDLDAALFEKARTLIRGYRIFRSMQHGLGCQWIALSI